TLRDGGRGGVAELEDARVAVAVGAPRHLEAADRPVEVAEVGEHRLLARGAIRIRARRYEGRLHVEDAQGMEAQAVDVAIRAALEAVAAGHQHGEQGVAVARVAIRTRMRAGATVALEGEARHLDPRTAHEERGADVVAEHRGRRAAGVQGGPLRARAPDRE